MRTLYSLLLYLLTPLILLRLAWRGLKAPAYWRRWAERFGYYAMPARPAGRPLIWLHTVSVGEFLAALPLIKRLQQQNPQTVLLVTTTTPTGSAQVSAALQDKSADDVVHVYLPYDLPGAVRRFLAAMQPRLALIMETELWPNLFAQCRQRQIPLMLINARLSARSAAGYQRWRRLTATTLQSISLIAAQHQDDARRFIDCGAAPQHVVVTGNIKFDMQLPSDLPQQARLLRQQWGEQRPVWLAASTHAGEDEQVLDAYALARQALPQLLLVLVPRHPERFQTVAALCRQRGYDTVLRSEQRDCEAQTAVFVGDTLGELRLFYAAADIAFVGGSLVATGGHNILEPAALAKPVIFGPHMFNFSATAEMLLTAEAATQVHDSRELGQAVVYYFQHPQAASAAGDNGRRLVQDNSGALTKTLEYIEPLLV